jgi:Flp pilus assembly protein TadG
MPGRHRLTDLWNRASRARGWWRDQRGSVLLFTTVAVVPIMIVMGGLAMDIAYFASVDAELQRSMDAAALAGAGKLGFDDSVFPTVRQTARDYATRNSYRGGTVSLDLNTGNSATGNVVLGIWDGNARTFSPSVDGSRVNAVRCRYNTTVPTSFLRLLGILGLPSGAEAIAIANPPAQPSCGEPILPIAVKACAFKNADGTYNNSNGCGSTLSWISSNGCDDPLRCNSAAWASLDGSNWTQHEIQDAIQNAASPTPACNVTINTGQNTYTDNGMTQPTFRTLRDTAMANMSPLASPVTHADGSVAYAAGNPGWETGVMVIGCDSPGGPITGPKQIMTFSKFVVTQIYDQQRQCLVTPNQDPQAAAVCAVRDPNLRAVFGYFRCDKFGNMATLEPVPRAALAPHIRLVQ